MVECKRPVSRVICFFVLFAAFEFLGGADAKAADMQIVSILPANNEVEVCADTKLWITFDTVPIVATSGNLQICRVSDDSVVWQLDLQVLSNPPISSGWPYQINLNGKTLNYQPFAVTDKTVEIYPSMRLAYDTAYYVKMTAGFCTDSGSNTSPAITDNTTWRFTTKTAAPTADRDYTVALDGSGDFCTLQGAVDAVFDNDPARTIIRLRKGTYREQVHVPSSKKNITWLGEDRDTTSVAVYNREAFNPGSNYRMAVAYYADGFRMYNMTLHNTAPDNSGQAETIKHSGQYSIVKNCKFLSYQDTLLLAGQMYLTDCYIEGDTDYVWGDGTVYFEGCELRSMSNGSYVTQPRQAASNNGYFLVDCNLTSPAGITNCYLGRMFINRSEYAQTVLINCVMPSTLFYPIGWNLQGTLPDNLRLWEYKSVDPNGNLIDVSQRVNPGSRQLSDAEAAIWRDVNNVFGAWNPKALEPPTTGWLPQPADGATDVALGGVTLQWLAGAETASHMVYFGATNPPPFAGEQAETSFDAGTMSLNTTYYWRIDEKNSAGTTTGPVWSFTTTAVPDNTPPSPDPMTWASPPAPVEDSYDKIIMSATAANDVSGVEYYFANITDPSHDSYWQGSNTYIDTNLVNDANYTYQVKARDRSPNYNETLFSDQASAKTARFFCGEAIASDLDEDCQVNFIDYAILAGAWVWPIEIEGLAVNGTFDSGLFPWRNVNASTPSGTMTATFDGVNGEPAGSALLQANTTGTLVDGHRFYQAIPVTVGKRYRLVGRWKGTLYDPSAGVRQNWAEVFIGFTLSIRSLDDDTSYWGDTAYKKQFVDINHPDNMNFDPDSDGCWDWEDITNSPNISPAPPENGVFVASNPSMVVSFNLGGNANGGAIRLNIDNIDVIECDSSIEDINGDCLLDMKDIAGMAEEWLVCNRLPADECWQ